MSEQQPRRLAILISGRGSNMSAFIDACGRGDLNAEISVVVSNNPAAAGLKVAAALGIPTAAIDHRNFANREAFDAALVGTLDQYQVDLVILAGFMRILTPVFLTPYAGRLLNIHPSLLPKYTGLNTHQRALDAGDSEAGVTVHFVTPELDGGPPILQARVPILPGDVAEDLATRVLDKEHAIYPIVAGWFLQRRLCLTEQGATLDGQQIPAQGLQYADDHC